MPNWCDNSVTITGDPDTLEEIWNIALGEDEVFQPMNWDPFPEPPPSDGMSWTERHWGTKWPMTVAGAFRQNDELIEFYGETAWGPCDSLLMGLSLKYPNVTVRLQYAEFSMDFVGAAVFSSGETFSSEGSIVDYMPDDLDWEEDPDGAFESQLDVEYEQKEAHAAAAEAAFLSASET